MGWKEAGESSPKGRKDREKFTDGIHYLRVERTLHRDKDRQPLTTKKTGDPAFRIVWRSCGMEGLDTFALSEAAQWKIARTLSRLGHDLDDLDAKGLELTDFTDEQAAGELLNGRWTWARVTRNGPYADFDPIKEEEVLKHMSQNDARALKEEAEAAAKAEDELEESGARPSIEGDDERNPDDIPF